MKVLLSYNKDRDLYTICDIDTNNLTITNTETISKSALVKLIYMNEKILNAGAVCGDLRLSGALEGFIEPLDGVIVVGRNRQNYVVTDGSRVWRQTLIGLGDTKLINARVANHNGKCSIELKRGELPILDDKKCTRGIFSKLYH